jgi:putative flippase GtrA
VATVRNMLRAHGPQLARFCVVGALCYLTGMATLLALCELGGFHYVIGYLGAFLVTNTLGYLLNGRFTFSTGSAAPASMARYMSVNIVLLTINTLALMLLVEVFHFWYVAATVVLAGINIPVSFIAHRNVSYRVGSAPSVDSGRQTNL